MSVTPDVTFDIESYYGIAYPTAPLLTAISPLNYDITTQQIDVDNATGSLPGVVTVTAQTFAGEKTFASVIVSGDTTVNGNLTTTGTVTALETTNTRVTDNVIVANYSASSTKDGGFMCARYQIANDTALGDVVADTAKETGTSQAGGASTLTLAAGASAVDNYYQGWWVLMTAGTAVNQVREVASYVGSTKIITLSTAWTGTPPTTDTYSLFNKSRYYTGYDESDSSWTIAPTSSTDTASTITVVERAALHVGTLTLENGVTIEYIDDDDTLAADSDSRIVTQKGIKKYVDDQVATKDEFSELSDVVGAYTTAGAIYNVNATPDGLQEMTIVASEPAVNELKFTRGTSSVHVKGTALVNQDTQTTSSPSFVAVNTGTIQHTDDITIDPAAGKGVLLSTDKPLVLGTNASIKHSSGDLIVANVGGNITFQPNDNSLNRSVFEHGGLSCQHFDSPALPAATWIRVTICAPASQNDFFKLTTLSISSGNECTETIYYYSSTGSVGSVKHRHERRSNISLSGHPRIVVWDNGSSLKYIYIQTDGGDTRAVVSGGYHLFQTKYPQWVSDGTGTEPDSWVTGVWVLQYDTDDVGTYPPDVETASGQLALYGSLSATVGPISFPPENDIVYVSAAGNDSWTGATIRQPKLTFGAAITAISSGQVVVCLESSTFAESLIITAGKKVYAPNVTFSQGGHTLAADSSLVCDTITASSGVAISINAAASTAHVTLSNLTLTGSADGVNCVQGKILLHIQHILVETGRVIKETVAQEVYLTFEEIVFTGAGTAFSVTNSGDVVIQGSSVEMVTFGATLFFTNAPSACNMQAMITKVDLGTSGILSNISANAVVKLIAGTIRGTHTQIGSITIDYSTFDTIRTRSSLDILSTGILSLDSTGAATRLCCGAYAQPLDIATGSTIKAVTFGGVNTTTRHYGTLQLSTGAIITEYSIDGTLADNSDSACPTEKAVKTYADNLTLLGLTDTPGSFTTAKSIYKVNDGTSAMEECGAGLIYDSTTGLVTTKGLDVSGSNPFNITSSVNSAISTTSTGTLSIDTGGNLSINTAANISIGDSIDDVGQINIGTSSGTGRAIILGKVSVNRITLNASGSCGWGASNYIRLDAVNEISLNSSAGVLNLATDSDTGAVNLATAGVRTATFGHAGLTAMQFNKGVTLPTGGNELDHYEEDFAYSVTWSQAIPDTVKTIDLVRVGHQVSMVIEALAVAATSTDYIRLKAGSELPAKYRPTKDLSLPCMVNTDAGVLTIGYAFIQSASGVIIIRPDATNASSTFTDTNTVGWYAFTLTWVVTSGA